METLSEKMSFAKAFAAAALALALVFASSAAYAEGEEYVPPPEAHEGVGGWAVVDPNTGNVHGVIVGTIETFHSVEARGGMGQEYMGCHAGCVLRFQTRATADGNVAGWHGTQTHIDANGNATQSNDGSVKWNEQNRTFSISGQVPGGTRTQTLVPEKTARDAAGMNLHTGIIDIETRATKESAGQTADIRVFQRDLSQMSSEVTLYFPLWAPEPRIFSYLLQHGWSQDADSRSALDRIGNDVDSALVDDGYTTTEISEDPETGELVESSVIDEGNGFVQSVRAVTSRVMEFLGLILGLTSGP